MIELEDAVEYTACTLNLNGKRMSNEESAAQAIRAMAEFEALLASPKEVAWRKNLKIGDVAHICHPSGFHAPGHCYRVTKIGRLNFYLVGYSECTNVYTGVTKPSRHHATVEIATGLDKPVRLCGMLSKPLCKMHEVGLTEREYKAAYEEANKDSPFRCEGDTEGAWRSYCLNEKFNSIGE